MNTETTRTSSTKPGAPPFPFSAIVGQDEMKRALIFNAIDPSIGGVLITGTRGTAKSTAARAMAALLPDIEVVAGDAFNTAPSSEQTEHVARIPTPFVNLPIGATEDRVLGTLDVERVLQAGERHFEPGLLARANRGVLYVDEVNLLPDHLVDVLLDAVAMGINRVEREGVSFTHEARVILIGTMNPEEGELRPQLLDRFGLSVAVSGYFEPDTRKEVVRRRIAFDTDPRVFVKQWNEAEAELSAFIERARLLLASVRMPDEQLDAIVEACAEAKADGLRADIVAYKTARAIAAFAGRAEVVASDVAEAVTLALAHRRRVALPNPKSGSNPETPPPGNSKGEAQRDRTTSQPQMPPRSTSSWQASSQQQPESDEAQSNENTSEIRSDEASAAEKVFDAGRGFNLSQMISRRQRQNATAFVFGRGSLAASRGSGRFVRAVLPRRSEKLDPAIEATIRAAALDAPARHNGEPVRLRIRPAHWRHKQRQIRTRNLILLLVDASGSMAAQQRMQFAKGAICSLLEDSYQKRDVVALIAFRGEAAEELLPPTRSAVFAYRRLAELPTGGRTPLAEGLKRARLIIERQARKGERVRPFLVVVTDGRATVPETGAFEAALAEAAHLRRMQVRGLCIDMETNRLRFGQACALAQALNATYTHIQKLPPKDWGRVIHEWVAAVRLSLLLAVLLTAACSAPPSLTKQPVAGDAPFPRVVRAASGTEVSIPRKPERIVSLTPSNDEILCSLVDEKRIAGLSKFSRDEATSYIADTARGINVFVDRNAEQIISLRPDLVLAARYTKVDLKGLLAETNTPLIITTDFRNFAEIEANVRLIGQAVGEEGRADAVIGEMRQKLAAARSRLRPEQAGRRVMYLASGNFTAGAETSIHEILLAAGLKNAAAEAGIKGHVKVASEQITQINPDVILVASGYERDRGFRQLLENDAQLSAVKAIKEKRIIEVPARGVWTVSHHVADAVEILVEAINRLPMTKGGKQ
ncbi:MAG: ABC transporter substrate-binding protein [Blastocatellia bacterium]